MADSADRLARAGLRAAFPASRASDPWTALAIHLALDDAMDESTAGRRLAALATHHRAALLRTLGHIDRALIDRPSRVGRRAEAIVREAIDVIDHSLNTAQRTVTARRDARLRATLRRAM